MSRDMNAMPDHSDTRQSPSRNESVGGETLELSRSGRSQYVSPQLIPLPQFRPPPRKTTKKVASRVDGQPRAGRRVIVEMILAIPNWLMLGAITFLVAHSLGLLSP